MNGYTEQPGFQQPPASSAVTVVPDAAAAGGWYSGGDQEAAVAPAAVEAQPEQQGFSIPTTAQTNGGGPMRQGRGGANSRFNPMARGKMGGVGDGVPASAATAEKNELGFIIFAYNIGYQTDESQVQALFAPYGTIAKINIIQDFNTGMNKGYAFVTMPNQAEAEAAVNALNNQPFNGNSLQVRFKTPKGQGPPPGVGGRGRGNMRGGRGGMRGGARGGMRGGMGSGGFRGARGAPRGAPRGRGRGAYSATPSAYDGYGYSQTGYDQYSGYSDPNAAYGGYDYSQAAAAPSDPYAASSYAAAPATSTAYGAYGGATGW